MVRGGRENMKYMIDDTDVFDLFHTLLDAEVLHLRMMGILKHIAGLPVNKERHEDKSYADLVRQLYETHFHHELK
jgi:hypothetical protein